MGRDGRSGGRELRFLRQALRLAACGEGQTSPNPMVGAVLVRGGRVVGRGFHTRAGAPHAEVAALAQAGTRARGSRLYVNLEPCCHFGRTPPCVDALIGAGVREVVASMRDPDPRVRGRGFRVLRAAGIRVRVGALAAEARRLNERFLRWAGAGLPFVTLKAGMSLDGRIATARGVSQWITSARARAEARRLRRRHDAVLIGVGTVLADDPALRGAAARVVLDAQLRTPPLARLLRDGGPETILLALPGAPAARRRRLERAGAIVVEVSGRRRRVDLKRALASLAGRGITSVLIEGGSEVLGAAVDAGLGDRVVLYAADRILGGRGALPAFGGEGAARPGDAVRLREMTVRRIGSDLVIEGRPVYPGRR